MLKKKNLNPEKKKNRNPEKKILSQKQIGIFVFLLIYFFLFLFFYFFSWIFLKNQNAEKKKYKVAILDDGLQQKNINYDLKIVCFNSEDALGNEYMLPAGHLRENLNEVKNYDLIFLNGEKKNNKLLSKLRSIDKNLKIFQGNYKPLNLKNFNLRKKYLMFCGIGNPHEFEKTLIKYKFNISKKIIYPDHYKLTNIDIKRLIDKAKKENLVLVTTEKDFFRLNNTQRKNIKFLKIELEIKDKKNLKKILISKL